MLIIVRRVKVAIDTRYGTTILGDKGHAVALVLRLNCFTRISAGVPPLVVRHDVLSLLVKSASLRGLLSTSRLVLMTARRCQSESLCIRGKSPQSVLWNCQKCLTLLGLVAELLRCRSGIVFSDFG